MPALLTVAARATSAFKGALADQRSLGDSLTHLYGSLFEERVNLFPGVAHLRRHRMSREMLVLLSERSWFLALHGVCKSGTRLNLAGYSEDRTNMATQVEPPELLHLGSHIAPWIT